MKSYTIYSFSKNDFNLRIELIPNSWALPISIHKWCETLRIRIFCLSIIMDWIPLPF